MEIEKALVQQFSKNFDLKAQQKVSVFEDTVTVETGVTGTSYRDDLIGSNEAEDMIVRGTPLGAKEMPHAGRYADLTDAEWWAHVYKSDQKKMLADPKSKYMLAGVAAMNRKKDSRVITALGGSARQIKEDKTSESIALPSAQKIVHGSTGLTRAKLVTALEILGLADVELEALDDMVTLAITQAQISDVLNDDKLTSADYNTVRLLVEAKIDSFMGAKWKKSNLLVKDGSNIRYCYMYLKSGVLLAVGENEETTVDYRNDLHGKPWQPYKYSSLGAVRREDVKVVEIQCLES